MPAILPSSKSIFLQLEKLKRSAIDDLTHHRLCVRRAAFEIRNAWISVRSKAIVRRWCERSKRILLWASCFFRLLQSCHGLYSLADVIRFTDLRSRPLNDCFELTEVYKECTYVLRNYREIAFQRSFRSSLLAIKIVPDIEISRRYSLNIPTVSHYLVQIFHSKLKATYRSLLMSILKRQWINLNKRKIKRAKYYYFLFVFLYVQSKYVD